MANLYDEINAIKQIGIEDITFDAEGRVEAPQGNINYDMSTPIYKDSRANAFWGEQSAVGNRYPDEFGDSKYDSRVPN